MVVSTLEKKKETRKEAILIGRTYISVQKYVHFMNLRGKGGGWVGVKVEVQYSM
jgi:hypothetical protein